MISLPLHSRSNLNRCTSLQLKKKLCAQFMFENEKRFESILLLFVHGRPPAIIIGRKFEKILSKITSLYAGHACY